MAKRRIIRPEEAEQDKPLTGELVERHAQRRELEALADKPPKALQEVLDEQHPLHGLFGRILKRLGGEDWVLAWAEEHPTEFMRMLMKAAPPPVANDAPAAIQINIDNSLGRSPLDG